MELRLHSPVGADPVVYKWPMIIGRGSVSNRSTTIYLPSLINQLIINTAARPRVHVREGFVYGMQQQQQRSPLPQTLRVMVFVVPMTIAFLRPSDVIEGRVWIRNPTQESPTVIIQRYVVF